MSGYRPPGGGPAYPYAPSGSGNSYGTTVITRTVFQNEKMEEELAMHIKKALSPEELAPKQKHVRACIVYTWDLKNSGSFWNAIRTYPVLGDEVVTFKALITVHKVMRQGHPAVLKDAIHQMQWFETLARNVIPQSSRGYGILIRAYVQFLLAKLEYHRLHPAFSGTFDYEEYVTLKGVEDPNEGFETINDLLGLLDKLDSLQKLIFANFRPTSTNEARIAALVPLVEESHGIYQFLVNMLTAMHQIIGSVEVLAPLRDKFKAGHYALLQFYYECSTLKYLTSLITVPKLPQDPPDFLAQGPPTLPARASPTLTKSQSDIDLFNEQQAEFERQLVEDERRKEQERLEAERALEEARRQQEEAQREAQRQADMQRQHWELQQRQMAEAERQRLEQERLRMQQAQVGMESQMLQQRLMNSQSELEQLRSQSLRDRQAVSQYEMRINNLEQQLSQRSNMDTAKDDLIRRLQEELAQAKQKYTALANLYASLRKEHLDLLNKFKEVRDTANRQTEQSRKDVEKAKSDLKAKSNEMTELLIERDRLKGEVDRVRRQYEEEIFSLRRDLETSKASLADLSSTQGTELQNIVTRYENEKADLINMSKSKQNEIDHLRKQLDDVHADLQRNRASQEEDSAVLQAGLDQTLLALQAQQKAAQDAERERSTLASQVGSIKTKYQREMSDMMDSILQSCISTVDESIYDLTSPANTGNQTASPEYALSLLEKSQTVCADFGNSFIKLVQTGDYKDAIGASTTFAHSIGQLLHNAKGVSRLAPDEEHLDELLRTVQTGALGARLFFDQLKSTSLETIDSSRRPEHIMSLSRETQHQLGRSSGMIERLVTSKGDEKVDLESEIDQQMKNAAKAIEDAARRLEELLHKPRQGPNIEVHGAILESAIAITSAIALLIKRATETQEEIVAHNRGSTTKGQFYKKNNKWTEGLISAAQAVATATTTLVECADGLISGTHSYEQLVVAAQEVSVATTQLVAASRVKSVPFSKNQVNLEDAAVAVRKATELLVKAAKEAAKRTAVASAQEDVGRMSRHQLKVAEMEQKVKVLEIENELQTARYKLGEIMKKGYRPDENDS
ncbi:ANTH domain-containing protein [Gaertneriomyces semiglobifer]|nr:ANTH domain-containing protein [Gaertneriomyces semiglobifer]